MFTTSPYPFLDHYNGGLQESLGVLNQSNSPGKYWAKQNILAARKTRSVHANIYINSSSCGEKLQVIHSDKGLQVMASAPTDSEWFMIFMTSLCSSIGECRKQDDAISIALIIEIQQLSELECQLAVKQNNKERIRTASDNSLFQFFTYCGSLRGYEIPKVLLHHLRHQILSPEESVVLAERGNYFSLHIYLPLLGRFKAVSQEEKCRIIDIC